MYNDRKVLRRNIVVKWTNEFIDDHESRKLDEFESLLHRQSLRAEMKIIIRIKSRIVNNNNKTIYKINE